jgi:pyridoxal phosphate enzyme (YggS family)
MIADNIKRIREEIAALTDRDITLVAATKTQSTERVREAVAAGVDACGENRVQELTEKLESNTYAGSAAHFIGHLQRNKVKQVVGNVELIQSVDSLELARMIAKQAIELGITQNILLEVNIGEEPSKSGFSTDAITCAIAETAQMKGLRLCGLMTVPPVQTEKDGNCKLFEKMMKIFLDNQSILVHNRGSSYLSMGMSNDYREAIMCGSNMIRLGTAIFGERKKL